MERHHATVALDDSAACAAALPGNRGRRSADLLQLRLRGRLFEVLPRAGRWRGAPAVHVQRDDLRGGTVRHAGGAAAVGQRGPLPTAGSHMARRHGTTLRRQHVGSTGTSEL